MGGGFAAPPITLASRNQRPGNDHVPTTTTPATEMHEKLLEKEDKTERTNLLGRSKDTSKPPKDKPPKQSKFAERLRRSFRRGDHRSLEIKRQEPTAEELKAKSRATPPPPSSLHSDNNNRLPFALSHLNLPGLGLGVGVGLGLGGHINPALLLDSPDECTPPEYAYQHLSSVATTNSSTSLESSCELGELSGSQNSVFYWASMGGEVSTSAGAAEAAGGGGGAGAGGLPIDNPNRRRLETQSSNRSDQQAVTTTTSSAVQPGNSSRSCSLTSESSSIRLTRLQNFLFKSSNESSRSCQGHSNEGFTVSSHNSSSGEWEQLGAYLSSSSGVGGGHDFQGGSFPEESTPDETEAGTLPVETSSSGGGGGGGYYQYTLTSPNNPFLPEITARTYHSTYSEDGAVEGGGDSTTDDLQLDGSGQKYGTRSAQLPTPSYSRAGSQESTHSEGGGPPGPTPSPASSSSSTPGRHRRKLFSLNSPTRLLHHQKEQPAQQSGSPPSGGSSNEGGGSSGGKFNSASLVRSLNPFLPSVTSPKKAPHKQAAVTSPGSLTPDLSTKREEFLRATMKICLVVSPPNSKLQLKSKSLTHLDGLDSGVVACQHGPPGMASSTTTTTTAAAVGSTTATTGLFATTGPPGSLGRQANVVSSSEFFSVSFCLESSQHPDEEFIPATKGVTLLNALGHALRRRNLSFTQITITDNNPTPSFLDAGPSLLPVSVDEQTDVESLAGHHLCITERGSNRKPLQKAASFGSRQPPPRLLPSVSTEETSESGVAAGKQIKQRWSSIFGIKNPQQSQLCELLNSYAKNGVPQRPDSMNFDHPDLVNSLAYLQDMHKSWRDFVESDAMSETEIKIQTAIWELVTTEVYYIHALQTVTELFLACLEAVQEERLLIDVDQARLFSNVRAVCEANIKFWTLWLYPMVAHSIITHEPLRCAFFQEGFIGFASIFAPYKIYCAEQSTCQFYCKELNHNNPLFTSYLAWCESQKMCNRLRLADIVVRPMQRLTKYSLLLAAIKKHMSDVEEIEAIDVMMHSVENFVGSVNNHLTMRQENERLKGVMVRIESYDVVDTNNEMLDKLIKQHSQMFDLCAPMRGCPAYHVRHLFMEGDHKFKDNLGKSDVHCFLLTDLLLVCKTIAKRGLGALKVIRQPYLTDQLIVQLAPNNTLNCVYLNEFQVATTAFTLQCTEAKNWYDAMWRAKTIYQRLKRGGAGGGSGSGTVGGDSFRFGGSGTSGGTADSLGVRKSPMNSSICSHVSSANNSHSGSVEWNDSRNISVDFEKTNSVSSDEGSSIMTGNHGVNLKGKQQLISGLHKTKMGIIGQMGSKSANTLSVQPMNHLGQSLPNLNMHHSHTVPLRRGMAFSTSTKNPPLRKTRNITSQNSINWHQIPATPTPPSPRSQHQSPGVVCMQKSLPLLVPHEEGQGQGQGLPPPPLQKQLSHQTPLPTSNHNQSSTETDV
ncbi:rho guanine nucleotide exchange factor 5 isoform X2 [Drosophila takahashii]|uniref:rho guanine nucleotide exchange factor 5 isoform X2 n=1 Tax=Drosophila takahashii TaxID=29030 RepID=UPI0038993EC1